MALATQAICSVVKSRYLGIPLGFDSPSFESGFTLVESYSLQDLHKLNPNVLRWYRQSGLMLYPGPRPSQLGSGCAGVNENRSGFQPLDREDLSASTARCWPRVGYGRPELPGPDPLTLLRGSTPSSAPFLLFGFLIWYPFSSYNNVF